MTQEHRLASEIDRGRLGSGFAKLLSASALSNLADGVLKVALPLIAIRFTDSPLLVAGVALALSLPWLLFALPAGAVADRADRRSMMIAANATRGVVAGLVALALVAEVGNIGVLYLAAMLLGTAEVFHDTNAQSILPMVVGRPQLTRANSRLYGAETITNQFAGPPLGGLLVGLGVALAVGVPAALWVIGLSLLAWIPGRFRAERSDGPTTLRADIGEGLRYLTGHRVLRTLAFMTGTANLASSTMFAILVLFAVGPDSPMGLSEFGFGVLTATVAVGAVIGSAVASPVTDALGRSRTLALAIVAFTAMFVTPLLTTSPWPIGAAAALTGVGIMLWNVIAVSLRQRVTPDALLGRVNSAYRLLAWGTMPLGAALGGVIGELLGLRAVFAVSTAISALTALGLFVVTDRAIADAEAAAD